MSPEPSNESEELGRPAAPHPESVGSQGTEAVREVEPVSAPPADDHPSPSFHEVEQELKAEGTLLSNAVGGWQGVIDSGLPAAVFLVVYAVTDSALRPALIAALVAAALIAVWRIVRREKLRQIVGGLFGVAFSAWLAARTGQAENFFLPGLIINAAYGTAFVISNLVRWPLVGLLVGALTGQKSSEWRVDNDLRRAYAATTWLWAGMFFLRLVVQVPLYLAGWVGPLGIAKLAMGWPLFLLTAWITYRVVMPAVEQYRARRGETVSQSSQ